MSEYYRNAYRQAVLILGTQTQCSILAKKVNAPVHDFKKLHAQNLGYIYTALKA